jgi:hypothetical protein
MNTRPCIHNPVPHSVHTDQMTEDAPTRFLTDDFSCRVLSDMIRNESDNLCTGLLYGVQCTSPLVVPIPFVNSQIDYEMWMAFDAETKIMLKNCFVTLENNEIDCTLFYLDQIQLPDWYSNNLLSDESWTWMGNVLLVLLNKEWPKCIVIPTERVAHLLQSENTRPK